MPAQSTVDRLKQALRDLIDAAKPLATSRRRDLAAAISAAETALTARRGRPRADQGRGR